MSNNEPESRGQFLTPKVTREPIVVDCSKWVDTSDGTWTFGNFTTPKVTRAPIVVDCSSWVADAPVWLELEVAFDDGVAPATVADHTFALGDAVRAAVPELGLTYDSVQSRKRTREEGAVVFALKPRNAVGAAAVLAEVADVIRKATATVAAEGQVEVRVWPAAA